MIYGPFDPCDTVFTLIVAAHFFIALVLQVETGIRV